MGKVRKVIRQVEFCPSKADRIVHTNSLSGLNHGFDLEPKQLEFVKEAGGNIYAFVEEQNIKCELLALFNYQTGELLVVQYGSRKEEIERGFMKYLFEARRKDS